MSKRKREILKKKKLADEAVMDASHQTAESTSDVGTESDQDPAGIAAQELQPAHSPVDDSQIVTAPAPSAVKKTAVRKRKSPAPEPAKAAVSKSWFDQYKENLLLGLLILYVFLLGLGTMGELLEIEWILNLPLFK